MNVSTEHIIIWPHFLASFGFQLSSVTAFAAFQSNQGRDGCVIWKVFERGKQFSVGKEGEVVESGLIRGEKSGDLLDEWFLFGQAMSLA